MASYDVQFDKESVLERLKEIRESKGDIERIIRYTRHELNSDLSGVFSCENFFSSELLDGELPTLHQRAYVANLVAHGKLLNYSLDNLLSLCKEEMENSGEKERKRAAEGLVSIMKTLSIYLPVTEKVLQLGDISKSRLKKLEDMDFYYGIIFYTYNLEFAPNFQREHYELKEDLKILWVSQFHKKTLIKMEKPSMEQIETKVDYLKNVIMPLIKNIYEHAFNPENDIKEKLKDVACSLSFTTYSEVDENNQEVIATVKDRGFGIRPELEKKLFQRGTSTKRDKETEHGIGLWAVKNFVEENGGRIWYDTELGEGTSFHFTIPYKEKEHFVYRQ